MNFIIKIVFAIFARVSVKKISKPYFCNIYNMELGEQHHPSPPPLHMSTSPNKYITHFYFSFFSFLTFVKSVFRFRKYRLTL